MSGHPGMRLEWGPQDLERLKSMNHDLRQAIWNAPCLIARPGENTYECRIESPCRVCAWRKEVMSSFKEDYSENL